MNPYPTKTKRLPGTSYREAVNSATKLFSEVEKKTKRRPYLLSSYFNKQKVFFDYFWRHLYQKKPKERMIRLRYFGAALEVIKKSRNHSISEENRHKKSEMLHRFLGITKDKELFYVQIKEDRRSGKKYFMSCFPAK